MLAALLPLAAQARTRAAATAVVAYGFVVGYTVTEGGSGYSLPPHVTVSGGGGAGAPAVAAVSNGVVTGITAVQSGRGYTNQPAVVLSAPGGGACGSGGHSVAGD